MLQFEEIRQVSATASSVSLIFWSQDVRFRLGFFECYPSISCSTA